MDVLRSYARIVRYRQIARVATRYGFGFLADMLGQARGIPRWRDKRDLARPGVYRLPRWERLRKALEELGPTFIKVGQILSMRWGSSPRWYSASGFLYLSSARAGSRRPARS